MLWSNWTTNNEKYYGKIKNMNENEDRKIKKWWEYGSSNWHFTSNGWYTLWWCMFPRNKINSLLGGSSNIKSGLVKANKLILCNFTYHNYFIALTIIVNEMNLDNIEECATNKNKFQFITL